MDMLPYLLICWQRPSHTLRAYEHIINCKPHEIYIFCDGFKEDEVDINNRVRQTRELIESLSTCNQHLCTHHTNFASSSNGCCEGVTSAIDWFFSNVEMGIIVEDDILIRPDFTHFCKAIISRNPSVKLVSASNNGFGYPLYWNPYRLSRNTLIWGWFTTKSLWALYEKQISEYRLQELESRISSLSLVEKLYARYAIEKCREVNAGLLDTWDCQLLFLFIERGFLSAIPTISYSENIGFDMFATHTTKLSFSFYMLKLQALFRFFISLDISSSSPCSRASDIMDWLLYILVLKPVSLRRYVNQLLPLPK